MLFHFKVNNTPTIYIFTTFRKETLSQEHILFKVAESLIYQICRGFALDPQCILLLAQGYKDLGLFNTNDTLTQYPASWREFIIQNDHGTWLDSVYSLLNVLFTLLAVLKRPWPFRNGQVKLLHFKQSLLSLKVSSQQAVNGNVNGNRSVM